MRSVGIPSVNMLFPTIRAPDVDCGLTERVDKNRPLQERLSCRDSPMVFSLRHKSLCHWTSLPASFQICSKFPRGAEVATALRVIKSDVSILAVCWYLSDIGHCVHISWVCPNSVPYVPSEGSWSIDNVSVSAQILAIAGDAMAARNPE